MTGCCNQKGQTLVQTLVSIGITAIVIAAVASFTVQMQKSNKLLSQKLEVLDLKNQLITNFLNPATCSCQLNPAINVANAANLKFNSANASSSMDLQEIRTSCVSSASVLVKKGVALPGTQTGLVVESVHMSNIESTGNDNEFYGTIHVRFSPSSLAGPLQGVKIRQKFFTDPSSLPSAKIPRSCHSDQGSLKVASAQNVIGSNPSGSITIDLEDFGFNPLGSDPHIIVSERDYNYDAVDGNTMDASYCGFSKLSKLKFSVICWASPDNSPGVVRSSFDWMAIQQ